MYQKILDYSVVRATVLADPHTYKTFAADVQCMIDRGYQPYGKPILTPERVVGFSEPQIVGYQTMVKYAASSQPLSNHP